MSCRISRRWSWATSMPRTTSNAPSASGSRRATRWATRSCSMATPPSAWVPFTAAQPWRPGTPSRRPPRWWMPSRNMPGGCVSIRAPVGATMPSCRRRTSWRPSAWSSARAGTARASFTATSGPGVSLMSEFLGLAYFAEIPTVLFDVQRAGPSTGMPTRTQQSDVLAAAYASRTATPSTCCCFPPPPRSVSISAPCRLTWRSGCRPRSSC